jgi:phenylalanine-4-hydroxylase
MPPQGTSKEKTARTQYVSKQPDSKGFINYSAEENATWRDLITRQIPMLPGRACPQWIGALNEMNFPMDRIPQLNEVSKVLREHTGWSVVPVPALIGFTEFFQLLAGKQFPVATFIRSREDFDYIQEPDVFHEVFGHTPPLTDHRFAAFVEAYGKAGLTADPKDHAMLARLFWFTVEFGLVKTTEGVRAYGSGIMSSPGELTYAVESDVPERKPFEPVDVLRTPYRIDILQPIYFVIDSFDELFDMARADLLGYIKEARRQGMHEPKFPPKAAA